MLVYKSTRDRRIAALFLVYTDIFLSGILDLPPTTKWEMNTGVVNSISVHSDMVSEGFL